MQQLKLTIIIATFNAELFIKEALKSVQNQSFNHWECIVVDGASTDNTMQIVKQFAIKDKRISYVSEKDKGIYDAFNKGWKLAKGKWIYYLGADDKLTVQGFKEIFSYDLDSFDIVYGNIIYNNNSSFVCKKSNSNISSVKKRLWCSHQGVLMKCSAIEKAGGFNMVNYSISADYALILKAYLAGASVYYVDTNVSVFSTSGASGGYKMEIECFMIRKHFHSIGIINNLFLLFRGEVMLFLRKLKYSIK